MGFVLYIEGFVLYIVGFVLYIVGCLYFEDEFQFLWQKLTVVTIFLIFRRHSVTQISPLKNLFCCLSIIEMTF